MEFGCLTLFWSGEMRTVMEPLEVWSEGRRVFAAQSHSEELYGRTVSFAGSLLERRAKPSDEAKTTCDEAGTAIEMEATPCVHWRWKS